MDVDHVKRPRDVQRQHGQRERTSVADQARQMILFWADGLQYTHLCRSRGDLQAGNEQQAEHLQQPWVLLCQALAKVWAVLGCAYGLNGAGNEPQDGRDVLQSACLSTAQHSVSDTWAISSILAHVMVSTDITTS